MSFNSLVNRESMLFLGIIALMYLAWTIMPAFGTHNKSQLYTALFSAPASEPGLVGYWDFDQISGSLVPDLSGNGNAGSIKGSAKRLSGPFCVKGSCLKFDGVDDYVEIVSPGSMDLSNGFTVSMWVLQEEESSGGSTGVTKAGEFKLGPASSRKFLFRVNTENGSWENQGILSNKQTFLNGWVYLTATYDAASGTSKIYLNGRLDKEDTSTISGKVLLNDNPLWFGKSSNYFFKGVIDEVKIYNTVMSPLQVRSSYEAVQDNRPNIIVIMTDDQRYDEAFKMPKLQQLLASKGTSFVNSFVEQSQCCPSRAAFLTGQYGQNNQITHNVPPLGGYEKFQSLHSNSHLGVWLQSAGYYTANFGKYLNGYPLPDKPLEIPAGWNKWFAYNPANYYNFSVNEDGTIKYFSNGEYLTDVLTDATAKFILEQANSPRPYFIWLNYFAPHVNGNYEVPVASRHANKFSSEPLPDDPSFNEADLSDKPGFFRNWPLFSQSDIDWVKGFYRNRLRALQAVDEGIEKIISTLESSGKLENTYIFFTSDNGWFLGEHRLLASKNSFYEPSIKVPLIVRGPGIPAAKNRSELVSNIDFAPTIMDIANSNSGNFDGASILPLLKGQNPSWRTSLLVQGHSRNPLKPGNGLDSENRVWAIRTAKFVYALYDDGSEQLYNLEQDPYQLTSRHNSPGYSTVKQGLSARLQSLKNCSDSACWDTSPEPVINICPALPNLNQAKDLDGDLLCEDITGNGKFGFGDIVKMYKNTQYINNNNMEQYFDCTKDGAFNIEDIRCFFEKV